MAEKRGSGSLVKPLGVDDLRVVQKELYVARPHWYNMGLELGLKPDVLDAIKFRCSGDECFRETLKDYLKMTTPSWMALVEALRSPTVGQSQLAEKVEQKYCPSLRLPETKDTPVPLPAESLPNPQGSSMPLSSPAPDHEVMPGTENELHTFAMQISPSSVHSNDEQHLPKDYGCGCGGCSFDSLFEKGCPKPIPTMSSFPYLNTEGLDESQKDLLKGRLYHEFEVITADFGRLVYNTCESIKQDITVQRFVCLLGGLDAFQPTLRKKPLLEECMEELQAADSVYKVFLILRGYMSFFSYYIIEYIIDTIGTQQDKENLRSYTTKLTEYSRRSVFECPTFSLARKDQANLVVKVEGINIEKYNVIHLAVFKSRISKVIKVKKYTLRLCTVEKGCVQLTFQMPHFVKEVVFPLSDSQKAALRVEGVTRLTCEDYQCPLEETLLEYVADIVSGEEFDPEGYVQMQVPPDMSLQQSRLVRLPQQQIQHLSQKLQQQSNMGRMAASNEGIAEDKCTKLQIELEQSKGECCDLMDRLKVAHIERTEAIMEKDDIVLKYHAEKERRRRAEREVSNRVGMKAESEHLDIRVQELTVNIPVSNTEGHGMVLDCGVIVTDLVENGLSVAHGVRQGDEIRQVNCINVCSDRDPLEFTSRLLDCAAQNISLTIRRQVPASYHRSQVATPTSSLATPTSSGPFNPLDPQVPAWRASAEHPSFLSVPLLKPSSVPAPVPHKDSGVDASVPGSVSDSDRPAGALIAGSFPCHISQVSQDSKESGLYCISPPSFARARGSMELLDSITLRPTLDSRHTFPEPEPCILQEGEEGGEEEEGEGESSDNDVCLLQSSLDSAHRHPRTDSVSTNSGMDDSVKSYPGAIRRHKVSREERLKRISRSLDDLTPFTMGHQEVLPTPVMPVKSEDGNLMHNYEEPFRISPPPDHPASQLQQYSNVAPGSMLPAELCTSDNLMGAVVPDDRAQLLLEGYQKERQQYEEAQLKQQNARQRTAGRPVDVYTNPIDAIQDHVSSHPKGLKVGFSEKASPPSKFGIGTEGASDVEVYSFYSEVFDQLPPNQAESVGRPASKSVRPIFYFRSSRYDYGYEDVGDFGSSGKDGTAVKPSSLPSGSLGDAGNQDTKRFSGPHGGRKESSKEVVQLVHGKTRSFRLTSTGQVKKTRVDTEDSEPEDSNFNVHKDTVSQTQEHVVSKEDVDTAKLKEAAFEIEEDQPGTDSYAIVNVVDKKQYRAEADGDKAVGSGAPQHYSVKDSPTKPVAESTPV